MNEQGSSMLWSVTCPECAEVVTVPISTEREPASESARCSAGHDLFTFDHDTFGTLVGAAVA